MRAVLFCALACAGIVHAEAGSGTSRPPPPPTGQNVVPFVVPGGLRRTFPPTPTPEPTVRPSPMVPPSEAPEPPPPAPEPEPTPEPPTPEQQFQEANRKLDEGRWPDAIALLRPLVAQDHPGAACNLGSLYLMGRGVSKDPRAAAELYRKAAALGSINAQLNLGRMLERGVGVKRDVGAAVEMYREASSQGSPEADAALARLIRSGEVELEDKAERTRVLKAAQQERPLHHSK